MDYLFRIINVGISYYIIAIVIAVSIWFILKRMNKNQRLALAIILPYLFLIIASTILTRKIRYDRKPILEPLWSIKTIMAGNALKDWLLKGVIMNIFMLMPIGLFAPLLLKRNKMTLSICLGLGISVTIETLQLITNRGTFEIDDIITNTFGVLIGYGLNTVSRYILIIHRK